MRCSDAITASCTGRGRTSSSGSTALPAERIEIVPPGVIHAFFSPGDRAAPAAALGLSADAAGAAVRRPHPAVEGRGRRGRALGRAATSADAELVIVGGAERSRRRRRRQPRLAGSGRRARRRRSRPFGSSRSRTTCSSTLLPRRGCVRGAQPLRVVRSRRARGGGVRHARGGRRRSAVCSRWSSTGAPASSSTVAIRVVRRLHRPSPRRSGRRPGDGRRGGGARARLTPGRPPRRACAGSTPTSPPARSWTVPERRTTGRGARRARGPHRRVGATRNSREPADRGGRPGRGRRAALVHPHEGRAEGHVHRSGSRCGSARCTTRPT